jgi:hypothetical protein
MILANVWLDTLGDGLIRADAIIGVRAHPTRDRRETLPLAGRRRAGGLHRQRPDRPPSSLVAAGAELRRTSSCRFPSGQGESWLRGGPGLIHCGRRAFADDNAGAL